MTTETRIWKPKRLRNHRAAELTWSSTGDPLVMNTYLKATILVLAAVCVSLAALTFKSQQALATCTQ